MAPLRALRWVLLYTAQVGLRPGYAFDVMRTREWRRVDRDSVKQALLKMSGATSDSGAGSMGAIWYGSGGAGRY